MGFLLTLLRCLWHGKSTTTRSGSPRPSDSGIFMPDPGYIPDHGRHDNAISGGLIGPNTIPSGNTPSRLRAVVETRHSFLAATKHAGGIIMSQAQPADPAASSHAVLFFPTPGFDWKARFDRVFAHGHGNFLTFPFTNILDRTALFQLYQAVPEVLKGHPGLVDDFFDNASLACQAAEKEIEKSRLKAMPGDPGQIVLFRPAARTEVSHG
jgi:hypothetical protein